MLFLYSSCDIFSAVFSWSHHSSNIISLSAGQTIRSKSRKEARSFSQCQCEHILKGHQGGLLWQHIWLDSTYIMTAAGLSGAGDGWNVSSQTNCEKSLKHRERDSQRERERKIIRDRMKPTATQTNGEESQHSDEMQKSETEVRKKK